MEYSKNFKFSEMEQQNGKKTAWNEVGEESGTIFFDSIQQTFIEHLPFTEHWEYKD